MSALITVNKLKVFLMIYKFIMIYLTRNKPEVCQTYPTNLKLISNILVGTNGRTPRQAYVKTF